MVRRGLLRAAASLARPSRPPSLQHPQPRRGPPSFLQGEVAPEDRALVPGPEEPPSPEFLQQLREFTNWRMQVAGPATHLGARRGKAAAG